MLTPRTLFPIVFVPLGEPLAADRPPPKEERNQALAFLGLHKVRDFDTVDSRAR